MSCHELIKRVNPIEHGHPSSKYIYVGKNIEETTCFLE